MTDTDMTWSGDAGNVQLVRNGAAYVLNESGLVTKFDLTAGTAQTRQLDLQGALVSYGVVEGARLDGWIPVTLRDDSEGLLNPETGVYTPLPATWLKDQAVERSPVYCGGQRHDAACEIRRNLLHDKRHRHGRRPLQLYHLPRRVRDHFG